MDPDSKLDGSSGLSKWSHPHNGVAMEDVVPPYPWLVVDMAVSAIAVVPANNPMVAKIIEVFIFFMIFTFLLIVFR